MGHADTANGNKGDVQHSLLASEAGTGRSDAKFKASEIADISSSFTIVNRTSKPATALQLLNLLQRSIQVPAWLVLPGTFPSTQAGFRSSGAHEQGTIKKRFRTILADTPSTAHYGILCHTRCAMRLALLS
jgi:hypothetical protein